MKHFICAVYDSKAETFGQPAFFQTLGIAERAFLDNTKKDEMMKNHPRDFTLFHLGSYEDSTGFFDSLTAPVQISTIPTNEETE